MRRYVFVVLVAVLAACGPAPRTFRAPSQPAQDGHHADYDTLLKRYVSPSGEVDYQGWQANRTDVAALDAYLARVTKYTPKQKPALYPREHDQLSYWLDLYNALVLREVLRRWPLTSVRDYQPTLLSKLDTTKGFFRDLRFIVGGNEMSLDDIEHSTIRKTFADARIHFALNCGAASCPILRPSSFQGAELESRLQTSTIEFINSRANVNVDSSRQRIVLSKLFEWYKGDFVAHAQRASGNRSAGLVDFLLAYASEPLATELRSARAGGYRIHFAKYDWGVNELAASDAGAVNVVTPAPHRTDYPANSAPMPLEFSLLSGQPFVHKPGRVLILSFWATYCKPCRKSLPYLQSLIEKNPEQVQIVALSLDDSRPRIAEFLQARGLHMDVGVGAEVEQVMTRLALSGVPADVFLNHRGIVRFSLQGAASDAQVDGALRDLLALDAATLQGEKNLD